MIFRGNMEKHLQARCAHASKVSGRGVEFRPVRGWGGITQDERDRWFSLWSNWDDLSAFWEAYRDQETKGIRQ